MTKDYSKAIKMVEGNEIDLTADFHTLSTDEVDVIVAQAKAHGYRKPKNANGSTGRYFFQLLKRLKATTAN
jgi:hypothetical protein